jgi:amidohydrolase
MNVRYDFMRNILEEAKTLQDIIVRDRRYIHQNAEVGQDLPVTTAYILERLKEMGYEPELIAKSAVVAIAGGKKPGKTFLLRADMDALPIIEENDLDYKSKTKNMHACGHDAHAAMLLGAANLLKDHEEDIEGSVKLMFQPAEEELSGAKAMIKAGVLENPKIDAAAMVHIFSGLPLPAGTLIMPEEGYVSSSADMFHIDINGKGGHGAMPQNSVDPLNVAAHIHIALQEVIAREVPPDSTAVITIGQMHGGNAANIIPDKAYLEGTIRAFNNSEREFMKNRVVEVATGIAATFRATAKVEYRMECPSVYNNPELYDQILKINSEFLGKENIKSFKDIYPSGKMTGSEDFGYVSEKVPSLMMVLGGGSPEEGYPYPQHHPKVNFHEDVFHIGSAVYANTAIEWLKKNK